MPGYSNKKRITAVVNESEYHEIQYWADQMGMNVNDLVRESITTFIKLKNNDYFIDSIGVERFNQLIDAVAALSSNVAGLEYITSSGFKQLLAFTNGKNYLLDDPKGV